MKRAWIFVALVMGLMVVAATYATWTETLKASGSVATGELDVAFTSASASDSDDESGLAGTATTTVELKDNDGDGDTETAVITVTTAYPGYEGTVTLDVTNVGSIAAKISDVKVEYADEASKDALSVTTSGVSAGDIIDVGQSKTLTIKIKVTDNAEENESYGFTVTIDATQFNA